MRANTSNAMIDEDEEQKEFQTIWKSHKSQSHRRSVAFNKPLEACRKIEKYLVESYLSDTIQQIVGQCRDEIENGVSNQIFTVQFRKNQQMQFQKFLKSLTSKFEDQMYKIFSGDKDRVHIILLNKSQVREIVLHMYIYLQENPQLQLVVFIADSITDLDEKNIGCFQRGLRNKKFVAVLSTFNSFQNKIENNLQNFQKYHYKLYNSKDLFCKYMYSCLINPFIKPYLPSNVLSLISDIDYYSISFHESCRRFMYCLERSLLIGKKEHQYVQFHDLITLIQTAIINKFKYYPGVKNPNEKILKVILQQKQIYTISEKAIGYQIVFASGVPSKETLQQIAIIKSIRDQLEKYLKRQQRFSKFVAYLNQQEETNNLVQRKRRTRADKLGIESKKNITPKNKLQNQITKIIKEATIEIRRQAATIQWEDLRYDLRIKPEIPLLIKEAWEEAEQTKDIMEEITSNYATPLSKYLKLFKEDQYGRAIYILKCLQLAGIVDISKKQTKPAINCSFFSKAHFSTNRK